MAKRTADNWMSLRLAYSVAPCCNNLTACQCACAYNSVVHFRPLLFHAVSGMRGPMLGVSSSLFAEVVRVDLQCTWMVVERVALHSRCREIHSAHYSRLSYSRTLLGCKVISWYHSTLY